MIQKVWHIIGNYIIKIYRTSLKLAYVPKLWQRVKVNFIPKPGEADYTSSKSIRPISLTSTLLKGLERLVDRSIKEEMNCKEFLNQNQHAFQEGKSTDTALHALTSHIEMTLERKEYLIATFMDVAGAFDNITFEAVQEQLEQLGINESIIKWIKYMLE